MARLSWPVGGRGGGAASMTETAGRLSAPTIDDVARLAGVSRATASRALFSEKRPVSAANRARVLAAAEQLGYRINPLARSLTTKTVDLVAVLVNHIHDLSDLDLFDLVIAETQALGKQVILIRIGSGDKVEEFLRRGVAYHVDAALVFSDFAEAGTVRRMFHSDHVLMLNGRHDELSPAIIPDEALGIEAAVADAAGKGVRRAFLITGRASSVVEQVRIGLYQRAFTTFGIELGRTIQGDYSYDSGRSAGELLAGSLAPDAVFCTSDAAAMGLLDARPRGLPGREAGALPALWVRQRLAPRLRRLSDLVDRLRQGRLRARDDAVPRRPPGLRSHRDPAPGADAVRAPLDGVRARTPGTARAGPSPERVQLRAGWRPRPTTSCSSPHRRPTGCSRTRTYRASGRIPGRPWHRDADRVVGVEARQRHQRGVLGGEVVEQRGVLDARRRRGSAGAGDAVGREVVDIDELGLGQLPSS